MKILKVLVLLLSIAGGSLVVWNAIRDKGTSNGDEIASHEMIGSSKSKATGLDLLELDPDDMQVSPKSGPIMDTEDVATIVEDKSPEITITDEEVKRTRDMMLSTSKSGRIMSDDKIREMLEDRKKEESKLKFQPHLMHSSKRIGSVLDAKRLEKIIEGEKQDSNEQQELPPKEQ